MRSLLKRARNNLCKLSGEDYSLIRDCNEKIQFYFTLIGFFVFLILLFCFLSALSFTEHLFHNIIADIGIGIIWGFIVTNLYVLILYTITPILLPVKDKKKGKQLSITYEFNLSMFFRILLVILLSTITAQPLIILILKPDSATFAYDIKYLMSHNPLAWLITVLVIVTFLLPIYLKYTIRNLGEFYEKKANVQKRIISDDYKEFLNIYSNLIEANLRKYNKNVKENLMPYKAKLEIVNPEKYRLYTDEINKEIWDTKIEKFEYWENPPYRTINKSLQKNILTEQEFLNSIYPEID